MIQIVNQNVDTDRKWSKLFDRMYLYRYKILKINKSSKIFVFFPEKNSESPEVRFLLHFQKAKKVSTKTLMSTKTLSTKTLMDCMLDFQPRFYSKFSILRQTFKLAHCWLIRWKVQIILSFIFYSMFARKCDIGFSGRNTIYWVL